MGGAHSRRVAVVTGGGSGMGEAICEHLSAAGHAVAVLDVDGAAAAEVAVRLKQAGGEVIGCEVDVADRSSVDAAYRRVRDDLGRIGIVVTSAAVAGFVPFEELTADDWSRVLSVNLTGTFNSVQSAIADMVQAEWGRIVTISSAAGQTASSRQVHYSASKAGVIGFTRSLAAEYASQGITANTIPPFVVDTPMLRAAQAAQDLPAAHHLARAVPAGRLGTGDDIAAACTFLCSDAASYITGQVIAVNGGAVM